MVLPLMGGNSTAMRRSEIDICICNYTDSDPEFAPSFHNTINIWERFTKCSTQSREVVSTIYKLTATHLEKQDEKGVRQSEHRVFVSKRTRVVAHHQPPATIHAC